MVNPVSQGTNEFTISPEAAERLEKFLSSAEREARIHNINSYWEKCREWMSFQRTAAGVIIRNDSNLKDALPDGQEPAKPTKLELAAVSFLLGRLYKVQSRLAERLTTTLQQSHSRRLRGRLYHWILNPANPYFPAGFWKSHASILRDPTMHHVIRRWPHRAIHMLRAIDTLSRFVSKREGRPLRVLEIGSGPAILAGLMHHTLGSRHVLIDLPEQAVVGFSFLSECFPQISVSMPNETLTGDRNADIVIITPEQLHWLKGQQFDIVVNMFSFMEMSYPTVQEYLTLIRQHLAPGGVFYCLNRAAKKDSQDGTVMEFAKYGWDKADQFLHDQLLPAKWKGILMAGSPYREAVVAMARCVSQSERV